MYLIELRSGTEQFYKTSVEFAAAIRQGEVDAGARIYHRARRQWVSVTLHPQFKAHVTEQLNGVEAGPLTPPRRHWTLLRLSQVQVAAATVKREVATAWERIRQRLPALRAGPDAKGAA